MIINKTEEIISEPIFYYLKNFFTLQNCFLKLEGLNIAGSIKLKTALSLLNNIEKNGFSPRNNKIIESSSGNLGVALSIVCKSRGYDFTCVVDPNISLQNENLMKVYGANLIKVQMKDKQGGYLGTRIDLINEMLNHDKNLIWTNQYASWANPAAHSKTTAKEILNEFPNPHYIFIGAGTTGTLVGTAKFIKKINPNVKIIAVDSVGSVTFGFEPSKRHIPGLGTSKKPLILDTKHVDKVILVHEKDAVKMCHRMLNMYGLFLGGSTGSVLHAVQEFAPNLQKNSIIVAISPDFGDKYISTIYNQEWVEKNFNFMIDQKI